MVAIDPMEEILVESQRGNGADTFWSPPVRVVVVVFCGDGRVRVSRSYFHENSFVRNLYKEGVYKVWDLSSLIYNFADGLCPNEQYGLRKYGQV